MEPVGSNPHDEHLTHCGHLNARCGKALRGGSRHCIWNPRSQDSQTASRTLLPSRLHTSQGLHRRQVKLAHLSRLFSSEWSKHCRWKRSRQLMHMSISPPVHVHRRVHMSISPPVHGHRRARVRVGCVTHLGMGIGACMWGGMAHHSRQSLSAASSTPAPLCSGPQPAE